MLQMTSQNEVFQRDVYIPFKSLGSERFVFILFYLFILKEITKGA